MLKNRYQEILVGVGPMSLIRGLISLKRNRSTLLIDDDRFASESYHEHFLSELEVLALCRIGTRYDIPELIDLRQFLLPASIEFVTNQSRLKIGNSPFENLREVLRKYPELLDPNDLDLPYAEPAESFNRYFMEELTRYESLCYNSSVKPMTRFYDFQGPKWVKGIYQRFSELLNLGYASTKNLKYQSLLHLLSLSSEEKLKTYIPPEEVPFYFFRLLSPAYRLQDFFIMTQLKRRLLLLGGDYKQSHIQYWQLNDRKFENLLLESFEGVVSGERVLFFSHLPESAPFKVKSPFPIFRKTQLRPVRRPSTPYPPSAVTFITHTDMLGSDLPYRVLAAGDNGVASYHWPYPELPGSKAEFYDQAIRSSYIEDSISLPFEQAEAVTQGSQSVSLDMRELRDHRKTEVPILNRLPLEISGSELPIQGFEYWGPFRYRALGLLSICYGVEGV